MGGLDASGMRRGQVWWASARPPDKSRPVVLVSRDEAYERRAFVVVTPVTTRVRGIRAEVALGAAEGLSRSCVVNCDVLETVTKRMLVEPIGRLGPDKTVALDEALKFALGLE